MQKKEGKKYDGEKPRMDLMSSKALIELSRVLTFGSKKYDAHNWRQGINFSRIIAAIYRHIAAYNDGETNDPETGVSHAAHIMCEAMFLLEFEKTKPEFDDRFVSTPETKIEVLKSHKGCDHKYWAPMDENHVTCITCKQEINLSKQDSCI